MVLVSNRGPLTFRTDAGGNLVGHRGAGGLVSGIGSLVRDGASRWIAAAMTDGDRQMARSGTVEAHGFRVDLLDIDPETYRLAYDVVSNATLWFVHHGLFDLPRRPSFDQAWFEAWTAFRSVNLTFARAVAARAPADAAVLVQDYHLPLLAPLLRTARPDLRTVHFSHTPFAGPELFATLPDEVRRVLLSGMADHHACGFHTRRWERHFRADCAEFVDRAPSTFVAPLAPEPDVVRSEASSAAATAALASFDDHIGERQVIVRVDRIELSKNQLRGFLAFDELLARHPSWRGRVVFAAFLYPSRESLAEYQRYREELDRLVARINARWGTPEWQPILLDTSDDYPRSLAGLRRYDVLLVNSLTDGLNLVAKEGPLVNERDGTVLLSPGTGAWEELHDHVLTVHPFDISGTADALAQALALSPAERARRAATLRALVEQRRPADWLADQLAAAG